MSPVSLRIEQDVAVLHIDHPPVNGLGNTVRAALLDRLQQAGADARVAAIVIAGAGRMFCGGADIRQFGTPAALERPLSRDIHEGIRGIGRPVVAAIHGMALGGGLELALGCHFRVALADSTLGLPEVRLGLIPGGGGTQRLPRLIGLRPAIDMIVRTRSVTGDEAATLGLVDMLVDPLAGPGLIPAAIAFARARARSIRPLPDLHDRIVMADGVDFAARRAGFATGAPGDRAALAALDCLDMACRVSLDEGLTRERAVFLELMDSPESARLRAAFFARRPRHGTR